MSDTGMENKTPEEIIDSCFRNGQIHEGSQDYHIALHLYGRGVIAEDIVQGETSLVGFDGRHFLVRESADGNMEIAEVNKDDLPAIEDAIYGSKNASPSVPELPKDTKQSPDFQADPSKTIEQQLTDLARHIIENTEQGDLSDPQRDAAQEFLIEMTALQTALEKAEASGDKTLITSIREQMVESADTFAHNMSGNASLDIDQLELLLQETLLMPAVEPPNNWADKGNDLADALAKKYGVERPGNIIDGIQTLPGELKIARGLYRNDPNAKITSGDPGSADNPINTDIALSQCWQDACNATGLSLEDLKNSQNDTAYNDTAYEVTANTDTSFKPV